MKFRKKPVVIDAILYRGEEDKHAVREFVTARRGRGFDQYGLHIKSLEGWMHVSPGDWIIKPDIFAATYEAAE